MKPPLAIAGFLAAALHACVLFGPSSSQPARPLPVAAESLEVALTAPPEELVAFPETPPEYTSAQPTISPFLATPQRVSGLGFCPLARNTSHPDG